MVKRVKAGNSKTILGVGIAATLLAGGAALYAEPGAEHEPWPPEKESPRGSAEAAPTLNAKPALSVTVYNSNIALIRDVRNLAMPSGQFRLKLMDIAATVNPATVHFRSLNEPDKLAVLEQNYEYDLLEP